MEFKESLDIILRECRFVASTTELERLIPGAAAALPPLMSIRYGDERAPRFRWGYPIIPGRQHLKHFQKLFAKICENALRSPGYLEDLQALTPETFRDDPYLKAVSSLLVQTLAEGHFLKLDTIFWLFLADTLRRRINADSELDALTQSQLPGEAHRHQKLDQSLGKLKYRDGQRRAEVRRALLHSFIARFEYGWSAVKEVFGEVPTNPIARAMFSHRFVYALPKDGLYGIEGVGEALEVGNHRLKPESFQSLRRCIIQIILGSLERRGAGRLNQADVYLLRTIDLDVAMEKARLAMPMALPGDSPEEREQALLEGIAAYLSLQPQCYRYIFFHMDELGRFLVKPIESRLRLTREQLKSFKDPRRVVAMEAAYGDICEDIRRWDVFNTLIGHIQWVDGTQSKQLQVGGRPLAPEMVPINLDAVHQIYRRSRRGTAVFVDLIGFTAKTKSLSRAAGEGAPGEESSAFSLLSLAIQQLFSVRRYLKVYGGSPQGFEGDAILDIFPSALSGLRYISRFSDNYEANRLLTYRPFEGPAGNPYQEGWRVGLATGSYTVISLVGRSNEMSPDAVHERAVGHTINKASRLNSGKRGASLLLGDDAVEGGQLYDPLNLFRAHVDGALKLNNNGICSFTETFEEIKASIKAQELPYYCPESGEGGAVCGEIPKFAHYDLALIVHDQEIGKVVLVRKIPREPELKGLEDESCIVYEYVLIPEGEFPALLRRDKALGNPPPKREVGALGPINMAGLASLRALEGEGLSPEEILRREEESPSTTPRPMSDAPEVSHLPPGRRSEPLAPAASSPMEVSAKADGGIPASTTVGNALGVGHIPSSTAKALGPALGGLPSSVASGNRGEEALAFLSDGGALPGAFGAVLDLSEGGEDALGDADFLVDPLAHDGDALSLTAAAPVSVTPAPESGAPTPQLGAPQTPVTRPPSSPAATPRRTEVAASLNSEDARGGGALVASLDKTGVTGGGTIKASLESSGGARGTGEVKASLESSGGTRGSGTLQASLDSGGARGEGTIPASLTAAPDSEPGGYGSPGATSVQSPAPEVALAPPMSAPPSNPGPNIPSSLYVDAGDLEGYGYVLEEGNGPDQAPTAILVGCPRGQVLQDCHRYEPRMLLPKPWSLDEVLARFVLELDHELRSGSARAAHRLGGEEQVYMLDARYLFDIAQGLVSSGG